MPKERFKALVPDARPLSPPLSASAKDPGWLASAEAAPEDADRHPAGGAPYSRHSHGLHQFFGNIENQVGLRILDLAGVSQANVGFITGLGHRLYSQDFVRTLDETFGGDQSDPLTAQSDPEKIARFLQENLHFPEEHFDGVLVWDALEFLAPPLLKGTVDRLFGILKPGCCLLAFFHAEEKAPVIPVYSYRIADSRTLLLCRRGTRRPAQLFNNRGIERLFERFRSVKFFLARDHLREVVVTR